VRIFLRQPPNFPTESRPNFTNFTKAPHRYKTEANYVVCTAREWEAKRVWNRRTGQWERGENSLFVSSFSPFPPRSNRELNLDSECPSTNALTRTH
jgi:hypothetical protein